MVLFIYPVVYLAVIIFIYFVVKRIVRYINNPIHVRWELYPVAHEGEKASYGGSYLEDADWWNKPREKSRIGELKVMIPEILFLKAVWEHNRPLWYVTFPFHFGLYIVSAFIGLLGIGAIAQLAGLHIGPGDPFPSLIAALTNFLGPLGFIMVMVGAIGLLYKRMTDPDLRNYTTPEHFFNLGLFIVSMGCASLTWLFEDPTFETARTFIANLLSFNMEKIDSPIFMIQIFLAAFTLAYIPMTHMAHFFMKYFLYHDIRWGDEPNIGTPKTDEKINIVLNYPISWSASHISVKGKKTWAEVAMFNPAAEPEKESEKGKE